MNTVKPINKCQIEYNAKVKAEALERNLPWYIRHLRGESLTKLAKEKGVCISRMSRMIKSVKGAK